ncbi:hypothetical protein CRENBAI_001983 [Crenichthys baileyi]|uniref:Uncharacterized protein n=1 Tax=Crenichthys baileyi TaxID=28760 RepID=A0AAV9R3P0_9TELE
MDDLRRELEMSLLCFQFPRPQSAGSRLFANGAVLRGPAAPSGMGENDDSDIIEHHTEEKMEKKTPCLPRCWRASVRPRERATALPSPPTDCGSTVILISIITTVVEAARELSMRGHKVMTGAKEQEDNIEKRIKEASRWERSRETSAKRSQP